MKKRRLLKLSGYFVSLAVFAAGIAPSSFCIPIEIRPWTFLISIVWFVVLSLGVFSS